MRVLAITGLTGKSGGVFAEQIAEHIGEVRGVYGGGIRALVRSSSRTERLDSLLPDIEKRRGDLTDIEFLKSAFEGVDTVFHVAGVHWSREVAQAAAECRVRRLVVVHTTGVYSKYKAAGEEYRETDRYVCGVCERGGILLTVLRPTMIYGNTRDGNISAFIKMVDRFPLMPVVNGARYELQPVHYADLGRAYYAVLMNEAATAGREFILSGGEPILLRDMLSVIGEKLGRRPRFVSCPLWLAYSGAWAIYICSLGKADYREKVQRLCEPRAYPHKDAELAFGYSPLRFEEGVSQEIRDYLKQRD